jgi:hypothetical protein
LGRSTTMETARQPEEVIICITQISMTLPQFKVWTVLCDCKDTLTMRSGRWTRTGSTLNVRKGCPCPAPATGEASGGPGGLRWPGNLVPGSQALMDQVHPGACHPLFLFLFLFHFLFGRRHRQGSHQRSRLNPKI